MSDYMQEAERLLDEYGAACCVHFRVLALEPGNTSHREDKDAAHTALLAHIERGRVPDEWRETMRRITFAARTSGGTAGTDIELMAACDACEKLLAADPAAPDHSATAPAEVPMPEPMLPRGKYGYRVWHVDYYSADQMQQYGAACEAAGYARGLKLYNQLLLAVATKHPDETRHETALRYIRQAEESRNSGSQAAQKGGA